MWTCILLSDMQFDSVLFSFFWLIMTIFFHTPTPLFDSSSYISRQIKKKNHHTHVWDSISGPPDHNVGD
jgi:hypothetical protein